MWQLAALLLTVLVATSACTALPKDTQGALERVSGAVLRVGVSANPPWTVVGADGSVTGSEADIMLAYADSIGAEVAWVPGSESALVRAMEHEEIDVLVGGLTSQSPWSGKVALTRPYETFTDRHGTEHQVAIAVLPGENALLTSLETFLAVRQGEI
ncbi:ABC transporter substrate-binding protein [Parenemella sanctibonifatiensis]|uniref:ABC transporter substrate-binding protein n=1 Tax=Parenemella sanctibonifatiensis TaxID=2016505 RepID=A0A255EJS1_9ACTN|nr:ABC transporter substrate-binding protein [Parenemella sanctibonifatiensis]